MLELTVLLIFGLLHSVISDWYLMPVCGRLEPGMKVRFYASVFQNEWIIQFHVNRETLCYNGLMNLDTDRPFHVNHYFVHPSIPAHNRQFAVVAGPANSWDFYHWVDMGPDIQQNQFIQADVIVVNGGFDYYANGKYISSAMSNYAAEKVDCVLATMNANVQYKWIEGQPNCPYRVNDTVRPGFETTTVETTTTPTSSSSLSPTGSTPRPTPPPYFPAPGWPLCIPPFCYPNIVFPCHPLCYTNCPAYCPPACYVIPGYGYQPPPVYPSCNLPNLGSCLPYYGVAPYEAVPVGYAPPQCQYLPEIWPWIINWPPYPQTTQNPFSTPSLPTSASSSTPSTGTWPTTQSTQSTASTGTWPTTQSTQSTASTGTWPTTQSTQSTASTGSTASTPFTQSTASTQSTFSTASTPSSTTTASTSTQSTSTSPTPTTTLTLPPGYSQCPYPPIHGTVLHEGEVYPGCSDQNGNLLSLQCVGTYTGIVQVGQIIPTGCLTK